MPSFLQFLHTQLFFTPHPLPPRTNLTGKTCLITGGNTGIGLEAAKQLSSHQLSRLIIGSRNVAKGEIAKTEILKQSPGVEIEVWELDQEDWASVVRFGRRAQALERLDMVVLNAGVKNLDYVCSEKTGHEQHIQVNHLSTSLLSLFLLTPLHKTSLQTPTTPRLTIVSSSNHFWAEFHERHTPTLSSSLITALDTAKTCFTNPKLRRNIERYNTSKLLNVLWAYELKSKVEAKGLGVSVNTVNPGLCGSGLHKEAGIVGWVLGLLAWSCEMGGRCVGDAIVRDVKEGEVEGGVYVSEQRAVRPSNFVLSSEGKEVRERLWRDTIEVLKNEAGIGEGLLGGLDEM